MSALEVFISLRERRIRPSVLVRRKADRMAWLVISSLQITTDAQMTCIVDGLGGRCDRDAATSKVVCQNEATLCRILMIEESLILALSPVQRPYTLLLPRAKVVSPDINSTTRKV